MKNGDVIRVRQNIHITAIITHVYNWHDYPMGTIEELQTLLDQIASETAANDQVEVYLPAVTYEGDLELPGRSIDFYGSTDSAARTVLRGSVTLGSGNYYWINYF